MEKLQCKSWGESEERRGNGGPAVEVVPCNASNCYGIAIAEDDIIMDTAL